MAQTLRSQTFAQLDRDVTSGINSFNSALNEISKAKQAYDQGFYEKIGMQMDIDSQEFERAAMETQDPDELKNLQAQYESKMQNYVNSLKAPKTVREKWESTFKREYSQSLMKTAASTEEPRLWTNAKMNYDSQAKVVLSNGDLTYTEKEKEIERLYEVYKMGSAPYSIVGYVNTPKDYLKAGEKVVLTQAVDRFYAENKSTPNDFNAGSFADKIIKDFEQESGQTFDVSTRAEYKELLMTKIANEEQKIQDDVKAQAVEVERSLDEMMWVNGVEPDANIVMEMYRQVGAWSEETGISKYWRPYLAQYEQIIAKQIEYNTALQIAQENETKAAELTPNDWTQVAEGMSRGYVEPKSSTVPVFDFTKKPELDLGNGKVSAVAFNSSGAKTSMASKFMNEDGQINYSAFTGKETTLSFVDGSTITTRFSPLIDAMAYREGIVTEDGKIDKTSMAYKSLAMQAESLGVLGYFSDGTKEQYLDILRNIKYSKKENGEYITDDEYRHVVISLMASGHLTKDDIEGAGLYDYDSNWSKLESSQKNTINGKLDRLIENLWYGTDTKISKKNDNATVGSNSLLEDAKNKGKELLEVTYNANPQDFLQNQERILKEIAETVGNKELQTSTSSLLEKCMNSAVLFWGVGKGVESGISELTDVQKLMEGIYNPGVRIDPKTGARTYKDYTAYLVPSALNAAMEYMNEQYTDLNAKGTRYSLEYARNYVANALSNGASNYKELGYGDKTAVDVCILKTLVERDARDMLAKEIREETGAKQKDIEANAIFVTIPGFGVGMVYDGKIYASDGNVATKNVFKVPGTITEQAMKNIKSAAPGKAIVNRKDINWGTEVVDKSSASEIWAQNDLQVGGGR